MAHAPTRRVYACRVETLLDTQHRHEWRRGAQECARHSLRLHLQIIAGVTHGFDSPPTNRADFLRGKRPIPSPYGEPVRYAALSIRQRKVAKEDDRKEICAGVARQALLDFANQRSGRSDHR